MKKLNKIILLLISALFLVSCVEIEKEITINMAYSGDEIVVLGYLCNDGAVASIQQTMQPDNIIKSPLKVLGAKVELYNASTNNVVAELISSDTLHYFTHSSFIPETNTPYFIKVSAPGFESIVSESQEVRELLNFQTIELSIKGEYSQYDPSMDILFGKRRMFELRYSINSPNELESIGNIKLGVYDGKFFKSSNYWDQKWTKDLKMIQVDYYSAYKNGEYLVFSGEDQIKSGDSIVYNEIKYPVLKRIDGFFIKAYFVSDDLSNFIKSTNSYMEGKTSPFSALVEKVKSNMSNEKGFFGTIYTVDTIVNLPPNPKDTDNVYQLNL